MLKKLLIKKSSSITSGAIVIGLVGLASRFLGIIRDRVLAGQFGAGDVLDIYYASFRVPDLVFNLIGLGALSAGFIPVFIYLVKKEVNLKYQENKQAWNLVNNLLNVVAVFLGLISLIFVIFASKLVPLITPGFEPEKMALTIKMTQLMFLSPIFLGLSSVFGGVLQTFKRFFIFSLAPLFYNLGIIIGALFFVKFWGIYGLAIGVILGAFLHLIIQFIACKSLGYKYRLKFNFKNKDLRKIIKLMVPRILGLATTQINLIVITVFASLLAAGSLTVFNLANNLQFLPIGLIGISFAVAAFPALSKSFADKKFKDFQQLIASTFKQILFYIIPFSVLFIVLRNEIVDIILATGKFSSSDVSLTATTLGVFSLSLFAQALIPFLGRAFYAKHNTVIPFLVGLFSALVNVGLSWWLMKDYQVIGLAFAFSLSSIINFILLWIFLFVKFKNWQGKIFKSAFKIILASFFMGIVLSGWQVLIPAFGFWSLVVKSGLISVMGILIFAGLVWLFKCQEFLNLKLALKNKLSKKFKFDKENIA